MLRNHSLQQDAMKASQDKEQEVVLSEDATEIQILLHLRSILYSVLPHTHCDTDVSECRP